MTSEGFSKKFTIFVDMSSSRRSSRHLKEDSSVGKVVTPRTLDPVTALASLSGELKPVHVDFPFPNPSNYSLLSTPGPHSKLEIDAALKWVKVCLPNIFTRHCVTSVKNINYVFFYV
jgi:hypothetical protein